ncbi:MAG: 2-phosphosulfolactate phosphatase [Chitinophagaceae bacterium]|nr:2-phosphosulfolactate phosphatase [Chitinophagaceae bacterium]
MKSDQPELYTALTPSVLPLYDLNKTIVVIIDVLRATSTIAAALFNGAKHVIPVDNVARCIELGNLLDAITAGERDGKIAEGLQHGNSPLEYPRSFVEDKVLVLTTTNGTRLLYTALEKGAQTLITASFLNLSVVASYLLEQNQNVLLACAAWKNRINMEDTLLAGAIIDRVKEHFRINCDSSSIAHSLYTEARPGFYDFIRNKKASHFERLSAYGLEKDIRYCFTPDIANVLPIYKEGKLVAATL